MPWIRSDPWFYLINFKCHSIYIWEDTTIIPLLTTQSNSWFNGQTDIQNKVQLHTSSILCLCLLMAKRLKGIELSIILFTAIWSLRGRPRVEEDWSSGECLPVCVIGSIVWRLWPMDIQCKWHLNWMKTQYEVKTKIIWCYVISHLWSDIKPQDVVTVSITQNLFKLVILINNKFLNYLNYSDIHSFATIVNPN